MRKTLGGSLLVLLLTGSASAGIMPNGSTEPPPPPPASAMQEPTGGAALNGDISTPGVMPTPGASESLTQTMLDLLALLPSLL